MTLAVDPKSHSKGWLFCILVTLYLAGCSSEQPVVQLSGASMGTTWHVSYIAGPDASPQHLVQQGIEQRLEEVERSMSTYRKDSEISRFNDTQPNIWFTVSPGFHSVLAAALVVGSQSQGAYDVTVAPLVDLWGFGPGPQVASPPSGQAIETLLVLVGQDNIRLDDEGTAVMKLTDLSLDFSSIAKGYGVDLIANWLPGQGINRFLVEVGGEMRVSGSSGRGDPWRIAIEQPGDGSQTVAAAIGVTDIAVATSGDYRNYFEMEGRRYSHSIDPRTGYPVTHDLVSVTVVHASAMLADAWATALTVLGGDQAMAVAQSQGLAVYFIRRAGDDFTHSHTSAFAGYLAPAQQ